MLRKLIVLAGCGIIAVGLSGCCLFHCGHGYGGYCGATCGDPCGNPCGGCGNVGGGNSCGTGCYGNLGNYEGSYGACVTPSGCPECATGIYGAQIDPVQRARAVRLERMRKTRGYAQGRGQRQQRPYCGGNGYGCQQDALAYADDYGFSGGYYDMGAHADMQGFDGGMGYEPGLSYSGECSECNGGMGSGWMPASSDCQCGSGMPTGFSDGGWVEGPWVEESSTSPQPATTNEPKAMPMNQSVPDPMPVTQEHYFPPSNAPTPVYYTEPGPELQNHAGGSPIQPVLWVPGGL